MPSLQRIANCNERLTHLSFKQSSYRNKRLCTLKLRFALENKKNRLGPEELWKQKTKAKLMSLLAGVKHQFACRYVWSYEGIFTRIAPIDDGITAAWGFLVFLLYTRIYVIFFLMLTTKTSIFNYCNETTTTKIVHGCIKK